MTILFIDSFDLHRESGSSLIPGLGDDGKYWFTRNGTSYVDGYLRGGAARNGTGALLAFRGGGSSSANKVPPGTSEVRACFWARAASATTTGGTWQGLFGFARGADISTNTQSIVIQYDNGGFLRFTIGGIIDNGSDVHHSVILAGPTTAGNPANVTTDWKFYELYVNFGTGVAQAFANGLQIFSGSFTPILSGDIVWAFNHPSAFLNDIDHLIITSGERPAAGQTHAVAPTVAWDRFETGGNAGVMGNLVMNDASYRKGADATNTTSAGIGLANNGWVMYFLYPVNPTTLQPWTTTSFNTIQAWGVCTYGHTSSARSILRDMCLSVVETTTDPSGFPIISSYQPTQIAYFSGNWTKTDDSLALFAHVDALPRGPADPHLFISNPDGCILFNLPGGVRPIVSTGITFAQEYKEDYRDWGSVYGVGYSFDSEFITGYSLFGQGDKDFQSNYVTINYESIFSGSVNNGGAFLQGVWDYAENGDTGRWSTKQQVYNPKLGLKHQIRRLKVRGHGKAMQVRVTSEEGKNFILNGWSLAISGNSTL